MVLVSTLTLLAPAESSATTSSQQRVAAGCYNAGCTGKNPEAMGCGADARTLEQLHIEGTVFEIRYSAACDAHWARISEQGAMVEAQVNLDGNPPHPDYPSYTFSAYFLPVSWSDAEFGFEKSWTAMGAGLDATRACGQVHVSAPAGWTKWYCTGWY